MIKLTEEQYHNYCSNYSGVCLECGEIQEDGVEPDATEYECHFCEEFAVVGMEHALVIGYIEFLEETY